MCSNYPGIILEPALGTEKDKIEHLSSYAHVVHSTAKQVISRRRKNQNVFKMSKDEKFTCKACKHPVFHCQICKFVGFLLASSSWLLKLPNGCCENTAIVAYTLNLNISRRVFTRAARVFICTNASQSQHPVFLSAVSWDVTKQSPNSFTFYVTSQKKRIRILNCSAVFKFYKYLQFAF